MRVASAQCGEDPHQAEARVAAAIAAGGHLVTDEHAPSWWVLADAEGIKSAIAQAAAAAGDKRVHVMGGASIIQQALNAGLVDQFQLHVAPVLLGAGTPLFAHLHDPVELEQTATQPVTQRRQTPFGGSRGAPAAWPNPHGFVAGVNDPTGLVHEEAREYDSATGRFISGDPVLDAKDPQQMNGYAYASNNPITFSDPSGRRFVDDNGNTPVSSRAPTAPSTQPPGTTPAATTASAHTLSLGEQCAVQLDCSRNDFKSMPIKERKVFLRTFINLYLTEYRIEDIDDWYDEASGVADISTDAGTADPETPPTLVDGSVLFKLMSDMKLAKDGKPKPKEDPKSQSQQGNTSDEALPDPVCPSNPGSPLRYLTAPQNQLNLLLSLSAGCGRLAPERGELGGVLRARTRSAVMRRQSPLRWRRPRPR